MRSQIRFYVVIALLFLGGNIFSPCSDARIWTDNKGKTIEAEFVKFDGEKVTLLLSSGKKGSISITTLSEKDQEYVRSLPKTEPQTSESKLSSTEVVEAEGIGTTIDEAKRDAIQNAIQIVVGTLVDAETRVKNEEVIENILTASNAYMETYKVKSSKRTDGVWNVTITATVVKRAIQQRLEKGKESATSVDGAGLLAKIDTKDISEKDGMLLFAKVLRDQKFPYSLMEATAKVTGEPEKQGDETYKISVDVTCTVNFEKYEQFRQAIEPVLEKLAISKTKEIIKTDKVIIDGRNCIFQLPGHRLFGYGHEKETSVFVWINTTRNSGFSNTGWNVYEVPLKYVLVLYAYAKILPCIDIDFYNNSQVILSERIGCFHLIKPGSYDAHPYFNNCIFFEQLWDKSLSSYQAERLVLKGNTSFGVMDLLDNVNRSRQKNELSFWNKPSCYFMGPFLCDHIRAGSDWKNTFVTSYSHHFQISFGKNDLESLKTVKANVMFENPTMDEFYKKLPELADFVIVP
ncbi:MAG: hypothetical protein LBJ67_06935 [Planctomycetaceae bacterium]|jgi:hypothetical protein|nr:hypothetical protein [Planctomycetaceae bacterium]